MLSPASQRVPFNVPVMFVPERTVSRKNSGQDSGLKALTSTHFMTRVPFPTPREGERGRDTTGYDPEREAQAVVEGELGDVLSV